jgi:3'-5' exoribonuclease
MIADIKPGKFSGVFLVSECKVLKTRKDKRPYTLISFKDKSGEITAFVWDKELNYIRAGSFVKASGFAKIHKEELVLRLDDSGITPVKQPDNLDEYIYSLDSLTIKTMWEELLSIVGGVKDKFFKAILDSLLETHSEYGDFNLKNSPLTDERYGAYAGALLEHIVYVCRHIKMVQRNYYDRNLPLDPDLLVTIAILHDVGRLKAFQNMMQVEKTVEGKMIPSAQLSWDIVSAIISKIEIPAGEWKAVRADNRSEKLREGIMSASDGDATPMTIEALIVQKTQQMDALVGIYARAINFARQGETFVRLQAKDGEVYNG